MGAYGPQEKDCIERKHKFWERLSTEVEEAQENNLAFILQMDGNLWAGKEIIKNDVHDCNQNGKLFHEFLKKYPHLIFVNSLDLCKGLITRRRKTTRGLEEAVLDFFVICNKISRFLMKMTIDEEKKYVLSRYGKQNGKRIKKDSNHNILILYIDISYFLKKPDIIELFNFKSLQCQSNFYLDCENSSELMECFNDKSKSFENQSKLWFKTLKSMFHKSFKKFRCTSKRKETETSKLFEQRKHLIQKIKL